MLLLQNQACPGRTGLLSYRWKGAWFFTHGCRCLKSDLVEGKLLFISWRERWLLECGINSTIKCLFVYLFFHSFIFSSEEIVERAKQSFSEGVCEVWLTSEDTGAYGRDIGVTLPELLWKLVEVIPEGCRLRLGMTNPPYILDHLQVRLNPPNLLKQADMNW